MISRRSLLSGMSRGGMEFVHKMANMGSMLLTGWFAFRPIKHEHYFYIHGPRRNEQKKYHQLKADNKYCSVRKETPISVLGAVFIFRTGHIRIDSA